MDKKFGKYETIDEFISGELPWVNEQTTRNTFALDKTKPIPHEWAIYEWPQSSYDNYGPIAPGPTIRFLPVLRIANRDFTKRYYFVADEANNTLIELVRL